MNNKVIHYKYWIGILIGIIILIISATAFNIQSLVEKLAFAITLSSFVLSLLAIYFTINFNSLFSRNVTKFLSINQEVDSTSTKLLTIVKDLNLKINEIPDSLKNIETKVEMTYKKLEENEIINFKKEITEDTDIDNPIINWDKNKVENFFVRSAFIHMTYLYFISKLFTNQIRVTVQELRFINFDGFISYCGVCRSMKLIDFQWIESTLKICRCNENLCNNIDLLYDTMIAFSKDHGDLNNSFNILNTAKDNMDKYLRSKCI